MYFKEGMIKNSEACAGEGFSTGHRTMTKHVYENSRASCESVQLKSRVDGEARVKGKGEIRLRPEMQCAGVGA